MMKKIIFTIIIIYIIMIEPLTYNNKVYAEEGHSITIQGIEGYEINVEVYSANFNPSGEQEPYSPPNNEDIESNITVEQNGDEYKATTTPYKRNGCSAGHFEGCGINSNIRPSEELYFSKHIYNPDGTYIGEALKIQNDIRFVAGRFLAIDAFEEYRKKYFAVINPYCFDVSKVCLKEIKIYHDGGCLPCGGRCVSCWDPYWTTETETYLAAVCDSGDVEVGCSVSDCGGPSISSCRAQAESEINRKIANDKKIEPAYRGLYQDVNDINEGLDENNEPNIEIQPYSISYLEDFQPSNQDSNIVWRTKATRFTYNLQKACINQITAKVEYVRKVNQFGQLDEEPCPENYIESKEISSTAILTSSGEGLHVGQYFIPLNMKSTDTLKHFLMPNMNVASKKSQEICISFIEKYEQQNQEWKYLITDKYGNTFDEGTTADDAIKMVSGSKSDGGCYLIYNTYFKVNQYFYDEEEKDGKTLLSGYKYFYRPIDYTRPFPNGVSSDSYWYEIYNSNNNNITVIDANEKKDIIELNDSFKKISYATNDNYNVNTIREYNQLNGTYDNDSIKIYSSFQGMTSSGISNFISGNYGLNRMECNSVYALGCGPANADWEACKNKTEVCN